MKAALPLPSGLKLALLVGLFFFFPDDDESDEESVKKTNKCSLVWEVSRGCSSILRLRLEGSEPCLTAAEAETAF